MPRPILLKALALWCAILLLAILNGGFREAALIPHMGLRYGTLLSGVMLSALIAIVAYVATPWLGCRLPTQQWAVGLLWLGLTLGFESGLGRYVRGNSWHELWAAYTFKDGNLWPVILAVTLTSPRLAAGLRNRP